MSEITVVAGAIIRRVPDGDSRLLLTQRARKRDFPLMWECPGGKVEPGEHPVGALHRELYEEIGWDTGRIDDAPCFSTYFERGSVTPDYSVALSFRWCVALDGWWPRLLDVEGAGWFTLAEMRSLRLVPGNVRFADYLATRWKTFV
jgi:8-oxo-dGTP diphosphatase